MAKLKKKIEAFAKKLIVYHPLDKPLIKKGDSQGSKETGTSGSTGK